MSFFSCFKVLTHAFRHEANSQSKQNVNAIGYPVNNNQGADLTEGQRGETSGPPRANDTATRLPAAGPLNLNLGDSAHHPVSSLKPGEAVGIDLMKFQTQQTTTLFQPTRDDILREQQPPPKISLHPLQEPVGVQIEPRKSVSTISGLSPKYSFKYDSDSSSYTSGSETSSKRSRRRLSTMSSDAPLKDKLHEHRVECPMGTGKFIVPQCAQQSLINESVVESAIRSEQPDINGTELVDYVQKICQDARRLFATLAYMRKEGEICRFVRDGVTDDDLPLRRKFDNGDDYVQWRLEGKYGKRIEALESWKTRHREKFSNTQCLMTSPVFELRKHYELDNGIILPFIGFTHEEGKELEFRGGGYSEVLIKCIHPSHHTFWERSTSTVRWH